MLWIVLGHREGLGDRSLGSPAWQPNRVGEVEGSGHEPAPPERSSGRSVTGSVVATAGPV